MSRPGLRVSIRCSCGSAVEAESDPPEAANFVATIFLRVHGREGHQASAEAYRQARDELLAAERTETA